MISIIIPTLNEERALPTTLASIVGQSGECEVIVVDGGSTDATHAVVARYRERLPDLDWIVSVRGRAVQQNVGAAQASGEWLLFLHADTRLPANGLAAIGRLSPEVCAGGFRQQFDSSSRLMRLLSILDNWRFHFTHILYGDQGLFLRRDLFLELGGFPDRPMEDVAFGLLLRSVTRPHLLPLTVLTDPRKFDQMGHWRALGRAIVLLIRFRFGAEIETDPFFDDYR